MTNKQIEIHKSVVKITCRVGDSPEWTETIPKEHYDLIVRQVKEEIKQLITDEISIAHLEGKETSRLTSLYNKI